MRSIAMAGLVASALVLSSCASEPSRQDLTDSIIRAVSVEPTITLTPDQARCMADVMLASDLSDTSLSGLAEDFDNPKVLETEVGKVENLVRQAADTCV